MSEYQQHNQPLPQTSELEFLTKLSSYVRSDAFNRRQADGSYRPSREALVPGHLIEHLSSRAPLAVFPLIGDKARAAVLDLDDHDPAAPVGWVTMVGAAGKLIDAFSRRSIKSMVFSSGGGNGIHIWLIWKRPQAARAIRRHLQHVLQDAGFKEGAKGVGSGQVEIYPKQADAGSRMGNAIAFPLSRKSVPLSPEFAPVERRSWSPPDLAALENDDLPDAPLEADAQPANNPAGGPRPLAAVAKEALSHVDCASLDYDDWVRVGMGLKTSLGDEGLELWLEWSAQDADRFDERQCETKWNSFGDSGRVTIGTVFKLAREGGWEPDFSNDCDALIAEINERYGILARGNRTLIIDKAGNSERTEVLTTLGPEPLIMRWRHLPDVVIGRRNTQPVGRYWLEHPKAERYEEVVFDPGRPPGRNGVRWNVWTGFGVEARSGGDWSMFQNHIREVVADGDTEKAAWLLNWMAWLIQNPAEVIGTAVLLKGQPGVGKSLLAECYGRLWGRHYRAVASREEALGKFNKDLFGRRLILMDEAVWGGDRKEAGILKARITQPTMSIEPKGFDRITVPNRAAYMAASNELHAVPIDAGERRWTIFNVSARHARDRQHFGRMLEQLNQGGYEAMLFDLQRWTISAGPDPRQNIQTVDTFEDFLLGASPYVRYLHKALDEGRLPRASIEEPQATTIGAMWEDLVNGEGQKPFGSEGRLARTIQQHVGGVQKRQTSTLADTRNPQDPRRRSTLYVFPPLGDARKAFADAVRLPVPWSAVSEWQPWEALQESATHRARQMLLGE